MGPDHPLTRPTTPGARVVETIQERSPTPTTATIPGVSEQQVSHSYSVFANLKQVSH